MDNLYLRFAKELENVFKNMDVPLLGLISIGFHRFVIY